MGSGGKRLQILCLQHALYVLCLQALERRGEFYV